MPIYEYECASCGHISSFMEKMYERPRLFGKKRRCQKCGGKKLRKVPSGFGVSVERTQAEMMNELKSMGNVQFVPQYPNSAPTGPPPGGCPYEIQAKAEAEKEEKERKAKAPIVVS